MYDSVGGAQLAERAHCGGAGWTCTERGIRWFEFSFEYPEFEEDIQVDTG